MKYFNPGLLMPFYVAYLLGYKIHAVRVIGRDETVTAGNNAILFCEVLEPTGILTSVTWQRRTKEKPTNTDFLVIASDGKEEHVDGLKDGVKFTGDISRFVGSVLLSNVTVSDEGIYTCVFSMFPSGPSETELHLTVLIPPVVSVSTDVPPVAGNTEEILATCTAANSKPVAEVSWSLGALKDSVKVKNNFPVDSEGRSTVTSILIGNASKELNQKKVQCLISHPGLKKKLELDYTLIVHYPPQVVYIISAGDQGETREFQCLADASPKPTSLTWSRTFPVKEPLSSSENRLIIHTNPDNNGLYFCVVSNQYGEAVGSLYLEVNTATQTCWTLVTVVTVLFFVGLCCAFAFKKIYFHRRYQNFIDRLRRDPVDH